MTLIDKMLVMGSGLPSSLRGAVTKAALSGSLDQVTQLDMTFLDPGWQILQSGLITLAQSITLDGFRLEISNLETEGSGGTEYLNIKARPVVVRSLKKRRGARVMKHVSPTQYVQAACAAVGAGFVGEPSGRRTTVSRDVPQKGSDEIENPPSDWTTIKRLATELGFVTFEAANTIYFGRPSWLIKHTGAVVLANYKTPEADTHRTVSIPKCVRTEDSPTVTVDTEIRITSPSTVYAGKRFDFTGVPTFSGNYIVTSFSLDLLDVRGVVSVTAGTPLLTKPQPPQTGTTTPVTRLGTLLRSDFLYWVQKQIGNRYVTGVVVDLDNPDPNVFDGSELVAWGAHQIGAFMPGKANDQMNYMHNQGTEISLGSGIATSGAILWRNNFIGISLGGDRVIESVKGKVGIIKGGAARRYKRAGKIPGVLY